MDREAMIELRNEAFLKIKNDATLWKQWHECMDEHDRELLMTYAVSNIVYERAYRHGWNDAVAPKIDWNRVDDEFNKYWENGGAA